MNKKYNPEDEKLHCLICGERIKNWWENMWQNEDGSSCGNLTAMMYHKDCYFKMKRGKVPRPSSAVCLRRVWNLLSPEQKKAVKAINGRRR